MIFALPYMFSNLLQVLYGSADMFVVGQFGHTFDVFGVSIGNQTMSFNNEITLLMNTPKEAIEATKSYLSICSAGIIFIVGYNVVSSILRGLGDSKTPLLFVFIACMINIVVDFVLVGYFHMGAKGAAIATVSAQ